jgi:hypothetical protein
LRERMRIGTSKEKRGLNAVFEFCTREPMRASG